MTRIFASIPEQLKDRLRVEIEEGRFPPGVRIEPERELARRWGVARLTAARALRELAREGFLERKRGRGTFVRSRRPSARGGTRRGGRREGGRRGGAASPRRIGLCFLDLYSMTHPYFARITRSLADHCGSASIETGLFTFQPGDLYYRRRNPLVEALASNILDGLIVVGRMRLEDLFALERARVPFIHVDHEVPGTDAPAVLVDYARGAFLACRHLIALGHRRIALILGTCRNRASSLSRVGYLLAFEGAGLPPSSDLVAFGRFDSATGYSCALSFLDAGDPPTAVFAADDIIATGVLRAAGERGLSVPHDLSVIGCGNFFEPHDTAVALTTVETRLEDVARSAADLLCRLVQDAGGAFEDVIIEPKLLLRESTAAPRGVSA
ncbi:MAG: GntR family transcriptional regulator [Planctomycetota bacterium]